jgi:selenophosphate synthetase-related protein
MLAECSGVGVVIDVNAVPRPSCASLDRWMATFPSYGYLIAAPSENVATIVDLFRIRDIAAADIGSVTAGRTVSVTDGVSTVAIRDLAETPLLGLGPVEAQA